MFAAMSEGCQAMGHTVVWQRPMHWKPQEIFKDADQVIVHGIQKISGQILNEYRKIGKPVWIFELPRLRDEPNAFGLYLNTVHWIPEEGYRKPVSHGLIKDRTEDYVLVCGQVPGDIAHGMHESEWDSWSRRTVQHARTLGLPVVYRQHPVYHAPIPSDGFGADQISPFEETIYDAMKGAAVVICHNSTVGWNAIDAGVPVVYTATEENKPGWKDYASDSIENLRKLTKKERAEAMSRVASVQWTLDELKDGTAAAQLFGIVEARKVA